MLNNETIEYTVRIDKVIFKNDDTGYAVLKVKLLQMDEDSPSLHYGIQSKQFLALGPLSQYHLGQHIHITGVWINHPQYEWQFRVDQVKIQEITAEDDLFLYLTSSGIPHIGEKTAHRLIEAFGLNTLVILKTDIDAVKKIKGLSLKRAKAIQETLHKNETYQELMEYLLPFSFTLRQILAIHKKKGEQSLKLIQENPYRLTYWRVGVSFPLADNLAHAYNIEADDPRRIWASIGYVMQTNLYLGNLYTEEKNLIENVQKLIQIPLETITDLLDAKIREEKIGQYVFENKIYFTPLYIQEIEYSMLADITRINLEKVSPANIEKDDDTLIAEYESMRKITLNAAQKEAVKQALNKKLSLITGGPGTGKTTILECVCYCFNAQKKEFALAAPTGKAAKRLSEQTHYEAKTLHRMLSIQQIQEDDASDSNRFSFSKETDELDYDCVIVDECSMIDFFIFQILFASIKTEAQVILVGDINQLDPVGPGCVYKDLIQSLCFPTTYLTEIIRQDESSLIIKNAEHILKGEELEFEQTEASHFMLINRTEKSRLNTVIKQLYLDILPNKLSLDIMQDVQLLCPLKKGSIGADAFNIEIQTLINTQNTTKHTGLKIRPNLTFYENDKVIHTKNNYDLEWKIYTKENKERGAGVFNGETGRVISIDTENTSLVVEFDDNKQVVYDRLALEDLDLAYAISVHKSQGSEIDTVLLILPDIRTKLERRNVLYTAITRAKKRVFLVANPRTIQAYLTQNKHIERLSFFKNHLIDLDKSMQENL